MSQALTPAKGSPCDIALMAIRAYGFSMSESMLAQALGCDKADVGEKLAYPIRMGVIRRSIRGQMRYYDIGYPSRLPVQSEPASGPPAAQPDETVAEVLAEAAAPAMPPPAGAPKPARKTPTTCWTKTTVDKPAAAVAPPPPAALPLEIPRFLDKREPALPVKDADSIKDAVDVIAEAAALAGVDIDAIHRRADGRMQARELIAAVMPVLTVHRFDVACFAGGRLLLELDGVPHVLLPAEVQRLTRALQLAAQA